MRAFLTLLIVLMLALSGGTALAQDATSESENAEVLPEGLERIRVLTEDAGKVVVKAMNFVLSSRVVSWWSADVFGRDGYVRIVACTGRAEEPACFGMKLADPSGGCGGELAGDWCGEFGRGPTDEWVEKKLLLHPKVKERGVQASWLSGGLEDEFTRDAIVSAFKGVSESPEFQKGGGDTWKVATKPGRVDNGKTVDALEEESFHFGGFDTGAEIQLLVEAFLALILFGFVVRRMNPDRWREVLGWTLITLAAFALRYGVMDGSVFHENHHGFRYLSAILNGNGQTFGIPTSYITLMHPLSLLMGGQDYSVFLWNGIFSALCCPLLGLLVIRVSGSTAAGWIAAIMWMITPHAIRVGASEIYFNFSTFMLLSASLACVSAFTKLKSDAIKPIELFLSLALATLLLALSAQVRVLTLMYPLGVAMIVFAAGGLDTRRQKVMAVCVGVVTATLLIPQIVSLLEAIAVQPARGSNLVSPLCVFTNIQDYVVFDPTIVSPTLLVFALVGSFAAVRGGFALSGLKGLGLVLGVLYVVALAGCVCGVEVSRIRFEVPANCMLTGLAGIGAAWVYKTFVNRSKPLAYGLVLVLTFSALWPWQFLERPFQDPVEFSFMDEDVIPALRDKTEVGSFLVLPDKIAEEFGPIGEEWWTRRLPGLEVVTKVSDIPEVEGDKRPIFAFIGLDCFWMVPGFEDIPYASAQHVEDLRIHPICAASLGGVDWKPVVVREMTRAETVGSCVDIRDETAKIGLFEGRRR